MTVWAYLCELENVPMADRQTNRVHIKFSAMLECVIKRKLHRLIMSSAVYIFHNIDTKIILIEILKQLAEYFLLILKLIAWNTVLILVCLDFADNTSISLKNIALFLLPVFV